MGSVESENGQSGYAQDLGDRVSGFLQEKLKGACTEIMEGGYISYDGGAMQLESAEGGVGHVFKNTDGCVMQLEGAKRGVCQVDNNSDGCVKKVDVATDGVCHMDKNIKNYVESKQLEKMGPHDVGPMKGKVITNIHDVEESLVVEKNAGLRLMDVETISGDT